MTLGKVQDLKFKTVRKGDKLNDVGVLQFLLKQLGYTISIDSIFGSETKNCVMHFQDTRNIKIDGIVGVQTWSELLKN